jgi:hypothetical protein
VRWFCDLLPFLDGVEISTKSGFAIDLVLIDQQRAKEKSSSDGHCQCEKEMDDHLFRVNEFLKESHIVTRLAKERALFLEINDINDIKLFGTPDCYHCCSIA